MCFVRQIIIFQGGERTKFSHFFDGFPKRECPKENIFLREVLPKESRPKNTVLFGKVFPNVWTHSSNPPGFLWDFGKRKVKYRSKMAIFGMIWGGFEGFGPCLGISHPTHPHLGNFPPKKASFSFFLGELPLIWMSITVASWPRCLSL